MHVDANGTRLWFDVDGPGLVTRGSELCRRPTLVLVHGGPGSFDHTYFKPDFHALETDSAIVLPWDREVLIDGRPLQARGFDRVGAATNAGRGTLAVYGVGTSERFEVMGQPSEGTTTVFTQSSSLDENMW